jgi:hypothetical protein
LLGRQPHTANSLGRLNAWPLSMEAKDTGNYKDTHRKMLLISLGNYKDTHRKMLLISLDGVMFCRCSIQGYFVQVKL